LLIALNSGLGKVSAKSLAREGVDIVVNCRNEERLEATIDEILSIACDDVIGETGDITWQDDVERIVDRSSGLDHPVTRAGGQEPIRSLETAEVDWYHMFDLLVMSVVHAVQEAAPYLCSDNGGTITAVTFER
jgi:3-oxoacyl-[acyl-carrier protein] reductase